jgi:hypothetical protein
MDNTFTASKHLTFELNGMYMSPLIQGTYDLTHLMTGRRVCQMAVLQRQMHAHRSPRRPIFNSGMPKTRCIMPISISI